MTISPLTTSPGKTFRCRRCGRCCQWEGAVKVAPEEAETIARFLNMDTEEFFSRHTRLTPDRLHLSLMEKSNGECEYLQISADGIASCAIEAVKPRQCRDFPEKWNFPGWRKECKGFS